MVKRNMRGNKRFSHHFLVGFCCGFIFLAAGGPLLGQSCTGLGQTPASAFPVCGTSVFTQGTVPVCGTRTIPVPCDNSASYEDKNPYWYKFTCFTAGTLGFVLTPKNLNDDYDWQLFDITGRNPNDVFADKTLFVSCNWSGEPGITGSSSAGPRLVSCGGYGNPLFSKMANLVKDHQYLLLVSHFSGNSQSGYTLAFKGGTADIKDPAIPALQAAGSNCPGNELRIKLNKKLKCFSLSADGSEFSIAGGTGSIASAVAPNCQLGFDFDSLVLTLNTPLPPGNYELIVQDGRDGNTLLDNCGTSLAVGNRVSFEIVQQHYTAMDSIQPVGCSPQKLQLVFPRPILCTSIAGNGSDFILTGPQAPTITAATASCTNGLSTVVEIQLASPIVTAGMYQLMLRTGTDGNTLLDECLQETAAGSTLEFMAGDTISAGFQYLVQPGCRLDTLHFNHTGLHSVKSWNWSFGDGNYGSGAASVSHVYPASGIFSISLTVSNDYCTDSLSQTITLDNEVMAGFEIPPIMCPEDTTTIVNTSQGSIDNWNWQFGNGISSVLSQPPALKFPITGIEQSYMVTLQVSNTLLNCTDSYQAAIKVLASCYIAVPSGFTPNGDGKNDYLYPLNALKADKLEFSVYNRWGQQVYFSRDWTQKWDGMVNGQPQPSGVYVWMLRFTHHDTGKKMELKGTTALLR